MSRKNPMKPENIQEFKWGGTTKEWEDQAEKISDQLETMDSINSIIEKQDCESEIKDAEVSD